MTHRLPHGDVMSAYFFYQKNMDGRPIVFPFKKEKQIASPSVQTWAFPFSVFVFSIHTLFMSFF
jgi:hypothetical protein